MTTATPNRPTLAIDQPTALIREHEDGTIDYHERLLLEPHPLPPDVPTPEVRPSPQRAGASTPRTVNLVLVALQLFVGYQWLVSGVDKLLYGSFPDQLGALVATAASSDRLPIFFTQFLSMVVLPNAYAFGLLVEGGETLVGAGLLAGAAVTLLSPLVERRARGVPARVYDTTMRVLVPLITGASLGALGLAANYYLLDGTPVPWFTPGLAYGGAVHPDLFLALVCLVILLGQLTTYRGARRPAPARQRGPA